MPARYGMELAATLCCAVFFGAALYISLVQHPAALRTGTDFAVQFFSPMDHRAAMLQASLAILGGSAALAACFLGSGRIWLGAGILILLVIPITLLVIDPLNRELKSMDVPDVRAADLLNRWGRLHWSRTLASGLSFLLCLAGLSRNMVDGAPPGAVYGDCHEHHD